MHSAVGISAVHGGEDVNQQSCEKYCEWFNVLIYACRLKCCHIVTSSVNGNDGPSVSTRCRHEVHEEATHASVAVRIGMYVDEHEMPEDHAHRGFWLVLQQVDEGGHQFANRVRPWWGMH
jgi:hypothetical protein